MGKKFLDFGAGTGIAYKAACELGFECYYQDLDNEAKDFTIKNFGLQSKNIIEDIESCDKKFDLIFSDNVIEHVKTPFTFIENLLNLLNDGGQLVIKSPHSGNTETYFNPMISINKYLFTALKYNSIKMTFRGFLKRFWHCDPPRHLYSFSKDSFKYLVEKSKHVGISHEILYYRTSWFSNTVTKRFFSRDKKKSPLKSIVIRLLVWPIILIEGILQVFQKVLLSLGLLSPAGIIFKVYK
ncbi:methyltransferase domain-containing protein [Flagellimonas aquimarina]|uniref:class I SAM-dependent methyltransferase n=1 Tax=Flagellimonas aquimarina TaxID=2201895 RepID=UPI001FAEEAA6